MPGDRLGERNYSGRPGWGLSGVTAKGERWEGQTSITEKKSKTTELNLTSKLNRLLNFNLSDFSITHVVQGGTRITHIFRAFQSFHKFRILRTSFD